jgi:hypothetical protein
MTAVTVEVFGVGEEQLRSSASLSSGKFQVPFD